MKTKILLVIAITLTAANAWATGNLRFSMQSNLRGQFSVLEINEQDGIENGQLSASWGGGIVRTFVAGNKLNMIIDNQKDVLEFQKNEKSIYYRGNVWGMAPNIEMTTYADPNGNVRIRGVLKGSTGSGEPGGDPVDTPFNVSTEAAKRRLYMDWGTMVIYLEGIKGEPGECKGNFYDQNYGPIARFRCSSSGSLEDTLFKNVNDIIAWLVHMYIIPTNN